MKKLFTLFTIAFLTLPILAQVEKKVIIEHFTNTRCGICSSRNPAFYQVLEDYPQVLHIAYHPSSPYSSCLFSQHNQEENDHRTNFYGVYGGTPRMVMQGDVIPVQNPLVSAEQIDAQLGKLSDYKLTLSNALVSGNTYKAIIEIERVSGSQNETILVYSGLAEKEIEYNAPNGEDLHHDVFRKVVFSDTASVNSVGQTKVIEVEYTAHQDWDINEIYAFAIIHNSITMEVIQSGNSIDSPTFISKPTVENRPDILFPNPASDRLNIQPKYLNQNYDLYIYSSQGQLVKQFDDLSRMNIGDLPGEIYYVILKDENGQSISTKLIVNRR